MTVPRKGLISDTKDELDSTDSVIWPPQLINILYSFYLEYQQPLIPATLSARL